MGPWFGLEDVAKRKLLILLELELRTIDQSIRRHSLYTSILHYPGYKWWQGTSVSIGIVSRSQLRWSWRVWAYTRNFRLGHVSFQVRKWKRRAEGVPQRSKRLARRTWKSRRIPNRATFSRPRWDGRILSPFQLRLVARAGVRKVCPRCA
jgi:hypothetical protein